MGDESKGGTVLHVVYAYINILSLCIRNVLEYYGTQVLVPVLLFTNALHAYYYQVMVFTVVYCTT